MKAFLYVTASNAALNNIRDEKRSDRLNVFLEPRLSGNGINIAYFVSNGYLVFTPNVHYKLGNPGPSVYDAVVSGAEFISKLPSVDSSKAGGVMVSSICSIHRHDIGLETSQCFNQTIRKTQSLVNLFS